MQKNRTLGCLSTIPGSIGRFFFELKMMIDFGIDPVRWAKTNQVRIDKIAHRYKDRYLRLYGKPLDWRKKSVAFERAIRSRFKWMHEDKVSLLREKVWTWRNWYDEERRQKQRTRIEQEGIVSFCQGDCP
jgi:hypothetical protein